MSVRVFIASAKTQAVASGLPLLAADGPESNRAWKLDHGIA